MPKKQNNHSNLSRVNFNSNVEIESIDSFIKNLEKHFFSHATIRNNSSSDSLVSLVIELDCNFGLAEMLHHFEKDTWGNFKCPNNSFAAMLKQLKKANDVKVEIEEFSLFLEDTSIVVNRIYERSIAEQLENIFINLNHHAVQLTKGFSEVPYEIYIAVFEDHLIQNEQALLKNIQSGNKNELDYFDFWGLYWFSEEDAVVYDLKNQTIIEANLQMLNQ